LRRIGDDEGAGKDSGATGPAGVNFDNIEDIEREIQKIQEQQDQLDNEAGEIRGMNMKKRDIKAKEKESESALNQASSVADTSKFDTLN